MNRTLIVMAKAPRLGQVKTRLARDTGALAAWALYRRMSGGIIHRLARDPRWRTVLAVDPDGLAARAGAGIWPAGPARIGQGRGNLGVKMERALKTAPTGPVVMVGTDCPDMRPHHIAEAFHLLGRYDAVFGPAEDGGFWLIGLARRPYPDGIFEGVTWSGSHTLGEVITNLRPRYRAGFVDTLRDIDTVHDWRAWRAG